MTRAIVIGDSHTVCIAQAAQADPQGADGIPVYRLAGKRSVLGDGSISIEEAVGLIGQLPTMVPIFLSVLGGFHNIMGMVRQEPNFDFLLNSEATVEDLNVLDIVPSRAVASAFDFYLQKSAKFLPIKHAARSPVFLVATPPPKERNEFIIEVFSKSKKKDYRGRSVIEIGLNTPRLRQKLWEMECERSKKWADSQGIFYLSPPKDSFDSNYFLRECYYGDATHANLDYGTLVLEQISEIVKSQKEDVAHG